MKAGDRHQNCASGQSVGAPGRQRVGDEHQRQDQQQRRYAEPEARGAERSGQPIGNRSHRFGQQRVGVRRRQRDQQAGDEQPEQPGLADPCARRRSARIERRPSEVEGAGFRSDAERTAHTHREKDARPAEAAGVVDIEITLGGGAEVVQITRTCGPLNAGGYGVPTASPRCPAAAIAAPALRRRRGTSHIASSAIRVDILLDPTVRSENTIGISRTRKPASSAR